ncbi:MAG TPA: hypothetical protein VET25_12865 [Aestuariivirgaceae bacterium]|nr:hypothetical protein [Aestuariivirgaceae bacterium]
MDKTHLLRSSILFAVLWTVGMIVWDSPIDLAKIIIWIIGGAVAGAVWYWLMGLWYKHFGRRNAP